MSKISHAIKRFFLLGEFLIFYAKEVTISNLRVAYDVITPTHHMRPAWIDLNISGLSDRQMFAISNLITMTPGTLSIDISEDRSTLHIHMMYAGDPDAELKNLEDNYLRRVRRVF